MASPTHRSQNPGFLALLLLLIPGAACTPDRYSAEPPAILANALAARPPGEGLTLYRYDPGHQHDPGHRGTVYAVAVTPDGKRAVSGSRDNTLKVWDLASGQEIQTLSGHKDQVWAVALTPDGKRAVSGSADNTLKVWDLESGQELQTLSGHKNPVRAVALTPDGKHAVSGSTDNTLKVWDLESGQEIQTLSGHGHWVRAVAVTPDGQRAVSGSNDDTLKVWDLESGKELQTLSGHGDRVFAVALTPDGRRAVSGSSDNTLRVWDLKSGQEIQTLSGHGHWVRAVAVTPDGQRAVSGSNDDTLKVWDLESGKELQTLSGHRGTVLAVALTPDGRRAVSGSSDNTLRVWDLESAQEMRTLGRRQPEPAGIIEFSGFSYRLDNDQGPVRGSDGEWQPFGEGIDSSDVVTTLAGPGPILYAATRSDRVYSRDTARSDATWMLYSATPVEGTINALWVDSKHSEILIAGTTNGLFWSRDGADTWNRVDLTDLNPSFSTVRAFDYSEAPDNHLYVFTDNGWYYAVDRIARPGFRTFLSDYGGATFAVVMFAVFLAVGMRQNMLRRSRVREKAAREQAERAERQAQQVEVERARENMRQVLQLPESPFRREGIELAHRLKQSTTISGDFYQLIPRQDGSLGIYLVDVEGHGLVASQTAQDLHRLLTDSSLNWGLGEPREQLRIADRRVSEEFGDRKISATMCFAEIEPSKKVVRFANAGMPYPLLFRRGESQPEVLRAAGFFVGDGYSRFPAQPDRAEVSVSEGDLLVLFSDGIPEAPNPQGRTFGQLGVIKAVETAATFDTEEVADTILNEVRRHSSQDAPADDQSLLVVRIAEPPSELPRARAEIIRIEETSDQLEASIWNAQGIGNELDTKLRPRIVSWVGNDRPAFANRIWVAIWEAAANAVKHGSERGDLVTLRLTRASGGWVEAVQVQPKRWPDSDVTLGERRRREVRALVGPSQDEPVASWLMKVETDVGTAIMLKEASEVRLTKHGRILTMSFDPEPEQEPAEST